MPCIGLFSVAVVFSNKILIVFALILVYSFAGLLLFLLHAMHICVGELDIKRIFVFDI